MKFKFNDKVKINNDFFSDTTGLVKNYTFRDLDDASKVEYKVQIENEDKLYDWVHEEELELVEGEGESANG